MQGPDDHPQLARIDKLLAKAHRRKHELKVLCARMASEGHDVSVEERVLYTATVSVLLYYDSRRIVLERHVRERLTEKRRLAKAPVAIQREGD
jgi:hypothetical protein